MIYNEPFAMFYDLFFVYIKINYYQLSRDRLLREAKDRYYSGSKEKASKYYNNN